MQDGFQEIPRRCLNCYILDKRPRLTENQVAHGILSARLASRLGSSPRLNASVDLEARVSLLNIARAQDTWAQGGARSAWRGGLIGLVGASPSLITRSTQTEAERNTR
jgi:hypothetical protein